jgi:DNA helicase HerA-like ATPase
MDNNGIGKVTATEGRPTSCTKVTFWVADNAVIRPFDIVRIKHISSKKGSKSSYTYAIVQGLEYITDSQSHMTNYVSSDFGDIDVEPQNKRLGTTIAEAEVLYNDQNIEMPVHDGAIVEWADSEGIKEALGLKALAEPIPAGYIEISNGEEIPIELEAKYLVGPEGAHMNIAGISGLATKTSYAMFIMNSIQQRMSDKVSMVIFNVKGSDLLAIDQPSGDLDRVAIDWDKCGLGALPFRNVEYLYPYSKNKQKNNTSSHVDQDILQKQIEDNKAFYYYYDVESGKQKVSMLFSDIDDPLSTMESIIQQLPEIDAKSWDEFRREVYNHTSKGSQKGADVSVISWRKFNRLLRTRTAHDIFTEPSIFDLGKRQKLISEKIRELKPGSVLVIDIEPLPDYLQSLVFGDAIQTIYDIKLGDTEEASNLNLGTVVIFADELNKYAPKSSGGERTLTNTLLEITERGRSLGVILFGAEQFRSGVHDRILGNCGTNVYGRTSPVEVSKCPDYRYFPEAHKSAVTRLPQGSLLLQHAAFKTSLIKVKFPRPSYHQPKGR